MPKPIDFEAEILAIYEDWKEANAFSEETGGGLDGVLIEKGVIDSFNNLMYAIREQHKTPQEQLEDLLGRVSIREGTASVTLLASTPADARKLAALLWAVRKVAHEKEGTET